MYRWHDWTSMLCNVKESLACAKPMQQEQKLLDEQMNTAVFELVRESYSLVDQNVVPTCPKAFVHRECNRDCGGFADGVANDVHVCFNKSVRDLYYVPLLRFVVFHEMGHIARQHSKKTLSMQSGVHLATGLVGLSLSAIALLMKNYPVALFAAVSSPLLSPHLCKARRNRSRKNTQEPEAHRWAIERLLQRKHYDSVAVAMAYCFYTLEAGNSGVCHPDPYAIMQACVKKAGFRAEILKTNENIGTVDEHIRVCVSIYEGGEGKNKLLALEVIRIVLNK
jgi:hypothetical protein